VVDLEAAHVTANGMDDNSIIHPSGSSGPEILDFLFWKMEKILTP
jgi:hypothetical protein